MNSTVEGLPDFGTGVFKELEKFRNEDIKRPI